MIFQAFTLNGVVPDVTDHPPREILQVQYVNSSRIVNLGNELAPREVRATPLVLFKADHTSFFTLLMVDPDAPSRKNPFIRSYRHWLVVNIPGSDVHLGQTVSEYVGLGTPRGTGLHRYVFLLFRQPGVLRFDEPYSDSMEGRLRGGFSVRDFARKYHLGDPVAGNFFQGKYDESVPSLQAQLGIVVVEVCPEDDGFKGY